MEIRKSLLLLAAIFLLITLGIAESATLGGIIYSQLSPILKISISVPLFIGFAILAGCVWMKRRAC